jgi:hypothetical protein
MSLLGPDGRPLKIRSASDVLAVHRFVKAEPVRRRAHRHAELRWWCHCGAFGPFLVRPKSALECRFGHKETCWPYTYYAGQLTLEGKLIVDGHFETNTIWKIAGKGVRALFGDA